MPELPEVETVRSDLARWLPGKTIASVKIFHPRAIRRNSGPSLRSPKNPLIGAQITSINRRGKFLWLAVDRPYALVIHLGMSGQVHLPNTSAATPADVSPHLRARIEFASGKRELHFVDQRTFGYLALEELAHDPHQSAELGLLIPQSITHIAPDLMEVFTRGIKERVIEKIRARKSEIKRVLLNQEVLSGVGNIYADEGLWAAKIHPESGANQLSKVEVDSLLRALHEVMQRAIEAGGTSIDEQYKRVNGESGYFDVELNAYGQDGEACPRCGTLIQRLRFMNRSSHLCPKCQKKR